MFGVLKRKHGITSSKRVGIFKRAHDAERKMETQSLIAKQSLYWNCSTFSNIFYVHVIYCFLWKNCGKCGFGVHETRGKPVQNYESVNLHWIKV
jgi:hypothetical protein